MVTPDAIGRDVYCPACGYNWRGLQAGRCPECGREFDLGRAQRGDARAPLPTPLDRCDPWQPHGVAIGVLRTMVQFALRPRRLMLTLDVNGPDWADGAMLLVGTGWIAVFQTLALTAVIAWRAGCSPYAALEEAATGWLPVTVLWSLPLHACGAALLGMDRGLFPTWPSAAQVFRLVTHWSAAQGCWHAAAVVAIAALGDGALEVGPVVAAAIACAPLVWIELRVRGGEARGLRALRALAYGALALAFGMITSVLGMWPDTVGPMLLVPNLF